MTKGRAKLSKVGWWWFGALIALNLCAWVLGWLDHSTELTPDHSDALQVGLLVSIVLAVASAAFVFWQSSGAIVGRLVLSLVAVPILAVIGTFLFVSEAVQLAAVRIDFPRSSSQRFEGLILISRAYQTYGKGRGWHIQTTPIWSDINVTQADYKFMLSHRRPGDQAADEGEIKGDGYFCAKVLIERAGYAVRVLNAGTYKLPKGSVGICSGFLAESSSLPTIR